MEEKLGGVILLKYIPNDGGGEFLWTHSSKTMCVSYMSDADRRPKVPYSVNLYFLYIFSCCEHKTMDFEYIQIFRIREEQKSFTFYVILSPLLRVLKSRLNMNIDVGPVVWGLNTVQIGGFI